LYNKGTDSFITFASSLELESYKYQVLAASSGSNEKDSLNSTGGKKLQVDWSLNIGEEVYDIKIGRYGQYLSASQSELIVLGERTLFCVKENGKITSQKRLDFFPSAMILYNQTADKAISKQNIIVATQNKTLMVYRDPKLIWAAGTNSIPVNIKVGNFGGIKSLIVLLDDQGNLSVNYLGTDAVTNPVPTMESKEIDYQELEEEHRKLQTLIRQTQNAGKYEPTDKLLIRAQVPTTVDQESYNPNADSNRKKVTVKLYLGYTGENVSLQNITLNITVQPPFSLGQSNIHIESLLGGSRVTPLILPITIYGGTDVIPTSLKAEVLAIYNAPTGEPRTTMCDFLVPMSLAGDIVPAKKISVHKITLDTNRLPPPMDLLFEDLIQGSDAEKSIGNGNILSIQYCNGQDATILVSKNAGRYRIQSGDFESLWIVSAELIRRLETYFNNPATNEDSSGEPFSIAFAENLPFHQYFAKIDEHFATRVALKENQKKLENMALQFRIIQKRLLTRYKDRNPTPINNMDLLFDQTYQGIISASKEVERTQKSLQIVSRNLACSTSLMLILLKLKLSLPDRELVTLRQYLSPVISDSEEQGWEETTLAGMTHLLRTVLAKSAKESNNMPQPLGMAKDTNKLKKQIALVYDRISKGMSLHKEKSKKKNNKQKKGKAEANEAD
jgi:Bardet-Biedl syndrome 9 protein